MTNHHQLNYIEIPCQDLEATKTFFKHVFDWSFEDYGPDYCAFSKAGIDGGFFRSEQSMSSEQGSALLVLYSDNLEASQQQVTEFGGKICKATFEFPGGRRFHFREPSGNEFAIWSE